MAAVLEVRACAMGAWPQHVVQHNLYKPGPDLIKSKHVTQVSLFYLVEKLDAKLGRFNPPFMVRLV